MPGPGPAGPLNVANHRYALGLDVGGTFTDVILARLDGSTLQVAKVPSVPADPARGFFDGVDQVLEAAGLTGASLDVVLHGSTVATNAVLEGRWVRTGLLVTEGFKYVLEIGRAEIPRKENLFGWVKPPRPVPPRLILEVPERVRHDGSVQRGLDEQGVLAAARAFRALGVQAVAVVFLHGYANPSHERRAGEMLRDALPGVEVSLASDVLPVFREYERAMATTLNAGVQPLVGRYVGALQDGLTAREISAPLLIMKSNGGVFSPGQASARSIEMALSGPAAGAQGAAGTGEQAGFADLMTLDMGGTSADVCLIRNARPGVSTDGELAGFPLGFPMVDIHTIGAGGGSIAAVSEHGSLRVGPQSAGAAPGPVCYGQGGERPTVTDANLVLGRIPPALLDGRIALDSGAAANAIRARIAEPLGLSVVEAAQGIVALVNNNMVGALKVISVERGYDPSDFTLCAFGGAGPVHGAQLLPLLGAARLLVPRHPGILCALGLLSTEQRYDFVRTCVQRAASYDLARITAVFDELRREARARLEAERVPSERQRIALAADLRYQRQGVELTVPLQAASATAITEPDIDDLVEAFHVMHQRLYTFADRDAGVEIINLRVHATGLMPKAMVPRLDAAPNAVPAVQAERAVTFDAGPAYKVPVYRRESLLAGHRVLGPAVVDQLDTTTIVFPEQCGEVDQFGNLVIRAVPDSGQAAPRAGS